MVRVCGRLTTTALLSSLLHGLARATRVFQRVVVHELLDQVHMRHEHAPAAAAPQHVSRHAARALSRGISRRHGRLRQDTSAHSLAAGAEGIPVALEAELLEGLGLAVPIVKQLKVRQPLVPDHLCVCAGVFVRVCTRGVSERSPTTARERARERRVSPVCV